MIKPNTIYHGFAARQQVALQLLTDTILKVCEPQKLFLLGLTQMRRRTETLFTQVSGSCTFISHMYVLVLVDKPADTALAAIQDKIENNLKHMIPATAIVLELNKFSNWLMEGHLFAAAVQQKALLLWQKEDKPLPAPAVYFPEIIRLEHDMLTRKTAERIEAFMAAAELFHARFQTAMAAFMLHQATEQALSTLLIIHTGLRVVTHNIDKLLRYCSMFCHELPELFNKNDEEDAKLLYLLQSAYIDGRYSKDFRVKRAEITGLTNKLYQLKDLFRIYCRQNVAPDVKI